jgi:uncharacterized membrane protein YqjE
MTDQQTSQNNTQNIAEAIQEVSERAQMLVREEIELAKAEVTEKVTKLAKGAVIGITAGIFAVFGLVYLLQALAWLIWKLLDGGGGDSFYLGFLIVAVLLFVLGGVAGFLARGLFKGGTPPTPAMAIEEAQLIKETVTSSRPAQTSPPVPEGER